MLNLFINQTYIDVGFKNLEIMRKPILLILYLFIKLFMLVVLLTFTYSCEKEEQITLETKAKFTAPSIIDTENNFKQKSTLNIKDFNHLFQNRDMQSNLTVDWDLSKTKKYKDEPEQEVDILYTPIYINNDAQAKMFIGSFVHNNIIESNLFCLIYTDIENTNSFSGYFLRFNLDGILIDAKKYNNGLIIEPSNQSGGSLGRSSNSECTDFSQLLECLLDYFGGDLDLSFWHLGGLLDEVVVNASIDAGPSGSGGTDSSIISPFNIPYIDNEIGSTGGGVGLAWWNANQISANGFNISQWLEINPLTIEAQWLMNTATDNQLQQISNFLNDHLFRIRDEYPDLNGFDVVNNFNSSSGLDLNENASQAMIDMILLMNNDPSISFEYDPVGNLLSGIQIDSIDVITDIFEDISTNSFSTSTSEYITSSIRQDTHKLPVSSSSGIFSGLAAELICIVKLEVPDANNQNECLEVINVYTDISGNTTNFEWTQISDSNPSEVDGVVVEINPIYDTIRIYITGKLKIGINLPGLSAFNSTKIGEVILTYNYSTSEFIPTQSYLFFN